MTETYSYRRELIADDRLVRDCNRLGRKGWCLLGMPREVRRPVDAGEPAEPIWRDGLFRPVESLWWDCLFRRVLAEDRPTVEAIGEAISDLVTAMAEADEKAALGPSAGGVL